MILVIAVTLIAAYTITILFAYSRIRDLAQENIRHEAMYIAEAVNLSGEAYLQKFRSVESGTRLTLIQKDGQVLYDTETSQALENHLQRPEVQEALKSGVGTSIRRSDTLGVEMYYCAVLLDSGNIIRISKEQATVLYTALELLPVMLAIAAVMLIAASLLARRSADALVRPFNTLDLDHPLNNDVYEELHPLLLRIDESNRAKEAAARSRQEFSANVSHELKTPLTSISGYAEIMANGLVQPKDIPEFASRIQSEASRLLTLIDDIMKLSKLDEGEIGQQKEDVDLFSLSRDICSRLIPRARDMNVHLAMSGEPCTVYGVRQLWDEMIYNITENAIKYNRKGGRVDLWVGKTLQGTKVIVTDTGIGIPKEDADRIFERFYRVDKSHSKEIGGTGLGLSIVKHGAIINGAKIHVDSMLGKGTRMELIVPPEEEKKREEEKKASAPLDEEGEKGESRPAAQGQKRQEKTEEEK